MRESNLELPEEIHDLPRTNHLSSNRRFERTNFENELKGSESQFHPKDSKLSNEISSVESNIRPKVPSSSKLIPAKSEQKQKIRGDRVRGSNKRVTSEKVSVIFSCFVFLMGCVL
jgi:hypothetical protein